jgi:hypothetical protein
MFDAQFYSAALPEMVLNACTKRLDCSPVVQLHLTDGSVYEVCQVTQLSADWLGLAYHRDGSCSGADFAFVPHAAVARVIISLQPAAARPLGFRHAQTSQDLTTGS